MRLGHAYQRVAWQCMLCDRVHEAGRQRIGHAVALAASFQHITPPLQADFAWQRFVDDVADAGQFSVEGVERGDGATLLLGHQQAREVAIDIR